MLTPPGDLADEVLVAALTRGWKVDAASMAYRSVGFGSHHWDVVDAEGTRWFVTVDELETKRLASDEPLQAVFDRLRASLAAACDVRDHGCSFAVAPVRTLDGEPLVRAGDRFGVALYPFVAGQSFTWGEFSAEHRRAVLDLVVAVHTAPHAVRRYALTDGFAVPHRDELEAALRSGGEGVNCGPYARPSARLLAEHAGPVRRLLARYDALVTAARAEPARAVLTHGEPHPGNTMLTPAGLLLIDWDTALVAPPERDLWMVDPGDGSILGAYADATGVAPQPSMLELYRIRWDLVDIAIEVSRFWRRHTGSADDDKGWELLCSLVTRLGVSSSGR